jgi:hypothetical protein
MRAMKLKEKRPPPITYPVEWGIVGHFPPFLAIDRLSVSCPIWNPECHRFAMMRAGHLSDIGSQNFCATAIWSPRQGAVYREFEDAKFTDRSKMEKDIDAEIDACGLSVLSLDAFNCCVAHCPCFLVPLFLIISVSFLYPAMLIFWC